MAEFRTIHTTYGLTAMAQAEATGTSINLTHMAVGDGTGNPVTPTEGQTNLVRELFRAPGKWNVWREGDKVKHERTGQ